MKGPAIRAVRGVVTWPTGEPMGDVLVEVYDHPEAVNSVVPDGSRVQHRLAACVTNDTGRFFIKVPPGSYEVRFSSRSPVGLECTSVLVRVRRLARRGRLSVSMHLAN